MATAFFLGNFDNELLVVRDCEFLQGDTWSIGGEYLQTFKPYGEKGRIPVAQFTGEAGYNL